MRPRKVYSKSSVAKVNKNFNIKKGLALFKIIIRIIRITES